MFSSGTAVALAAEWNKIYDTHEHFGFYWDYSPDAPPYGLRNVLNGAYLSPPAELGNDYEEIGKFLKSKKGADTLNSLRAAFLQLYDLDIFPLRADVLKDLDVCIQDAYKGPASIYRRLEKRAGVKKIILDNPPKLWEKWSDPLVNMTIRLDETIFPFSKVRQDIYQRNTKDSKVFSYMKSESLPAANLDDFDEALESYMLKLKEYAHVIKIGSAYQRTLDFSLEENDDGKIADLYRRLMEGSGTFSEHEMRRWGNYVVSIMLGFATIERMPVQVHTGLALMRESDPRYLSEIVGQFSSVKFDLFHGGYPYINQLAGMALTKANVFVDLCWLPILSQSATRTLLLQLMELGVSNKINGFGGDCQNFEGSYGALLMTKKALADVFLEKIESNDIAREDAVHLGEQILYDNPREIFG